MPTRWKVKYMQTIADRVREILPPHPKERPLLLVLLKMLEAIERVSSGGTMKFSMRNLFYAVIEIFHKKFPGEKFYEYNSFTQDFLRTYEKQHGKMEKRIV